MALAMIFVVLSMAAAVPGALSAPFLYVAEAPGSFVQQPAYWQQELVPVQLRWRRDVSVGVDAPSTGGALVTAKANAPIWQGESSRVDAHGHYSRTLGGPGGPPTYGGGLSYQNPRVGALVDVSHTPGFGTNVGVGGGANLYTSDDRSSTLDATAHWSRTYNTPWGDTPPSYGAGLQYTYRF